MKVPPHLWKDALLLQDVAERYDNKTFLQQLTPDRQLDVAACDDLSGQTRAHFPCDNAPMYQRFFQWLVDSGLSWPFCVICVGGAFYLFVQQEKKREKEKALKNEKLRLQQEQRARKIHEQFQHEYEQRKQALGQIVCSQCKWTGNWGEGMSYQEFFAYELHVKHHANNLSLEAQYKCPVCKSTNWQKL